MKYMMMFYEDESAVAARSDPGQAQAYWGSWTAYVQALNESGIVQSGNGLEAPHAATTVRLQNGARHVQDGPFADTKEQLGGYFVIEVPDLDAALAWAAKSPAASSGAVEVRPVLVMQP